MARLKGMDIFIIKPQLRIGVRPSRAQRPAMGSERR